MHEQIENRFRITANSEHGKSVWHSKRAKRWACGKCARARTRVCVICDDLIVSLAKLCFPGDCSAELILPNRNGSAAASASMTIEQPNEAGKGLKYQNPIQMYRAAQMRTQPRTGICKAAPGLSVFRGRSGRARNASRSTGATIVFDVKIAFYYELCECFGRVCECVSVRMRGLWLASI